MADDRTTVIYHGFNSFKLDEEEGNRVAVKIDYNSKTKLEKKEAARKTYVRQEEKLPIRDCVEEDSNIRVRSLGSGVSQTQSQIGKLFTV